MPHSGTFHEATQHFWGLGVPEAELCLVMLGVIMDKGTDTCPVMQNVTLRVVRALERS